MSSRREASEENHECAEEERNHAHKESPHSNRVFSLASTVILITIDMVLDDSEKDKVGCHHYDCERPCKSGEESSKERSADAWPDREEKWDEGEACHDRM